MQDVLIFVQNMNLNCSYLGVLKIIAKSEQPFANVLQNKCSYIAIFTEKQSFLMNFIKKRLQHRRFSLDIVKFLRITLL